MEFTYQKVVSNWKEYKIMKRQGQGEKKRENRGRGKEIDQISVR
jgi:hypothetical protein